VHSIVCGPENPYARNFTILIMKARVTMKKLTQFLIVIALLLAAVTTAQAQSVYKEAPMLTALVEAKALPAVDDRLPTNPQIIQPIDRVGVYGGTWHMAMSGSRDRVMMRRTIGYEGLVRWDPQWTRIIPNVAQSYEVSPDATEYVFKLRKGMRWSDGTPFTADDILFWYEAVVMNSTLSGSVPQWLIAGGTPVKVEKLGDYEVIFRFAAPNGLFLQNLAHPDSEDVVTFPKHYMSQFHADYNPNVADLVTKAGVKDWVELFNLKNPGGSERMWLPELPSLGAWVLTPDYKKDDQTITAVRNPYYWKVDTDFQQLPYLDSVQFVIVKGTEEVLALVREGKIDMQHRRIPQSAANPEYQQQGNYRLFERINSESNKLVISLNMNHPDPKLREVFQNRDFRIGLSYAINRPLLMADDEGVEAYQAAPLPSSPFFHARLARQYTEYNVALANEHLDRAGYAKRDADGFRVRPDGTRISFTVLIGDNDANKVPDMEVIQSNWLAVGIDMKFELLKRDEMKDGINSKFEHDAAIWAGDGGLEVMLDPRWYFPFSQESFYAVGWARWYRDPNDPKAQTPPAEVQKQMALFDQIRATANPDVQAALMAQLLEISADQFYVIGLHTPSLERGIVKNNFFNVPSVMPGAWAYPDPAPTNPSQYFIQ
jgi:peptide/nickel transport system substrate-binding protein